VGLGVMITTILTKLDSLMVSQGADTALGTIGNLGTLTDLFSVETMIPPYYLQIAIGIYLIQMIFILTGALVLIEDGEDRLNKKYQIGKNLKSGIFLFFIVSLISSTALYFLATVVLGGLAG
jgi:predicted ferric reductase